LRKKLGDESSSPRYIRTVRAVGYMFINPDDA
jgi:DNA-binding response OmpR family regulator